MKAFIVDDYSEAREALIAVLEEFQSEINIVGQASNCQDAIEKIHLTRPDILFLDIELKDELIFSLFDKIDASDFDIVFVTGYNEYAIRAFDFNAINYILKPATSDDIKAVLNQINERKARHSKSDFQRFSNSFINKEESFKQICISTEKEILFITVDEILALSAESNYCYLHLEDEKILLTKPLSHYEKLLINNNFYRCHKSYLINLTKIKKCIKDGRGFNAVLSNGLNVDISRRKKAEFIERLKEHQIFIE